MIVLGGVGLLAIIIGTIFWKVVGLIMIAYALREGKRIHTAKKAGETYCPRQAVIAYIFLIILAAAVVWYVIFGMNSPVNMVKSTVFDGFTHSVETMIDNNLTDVSWETEKRDGQTFVYVYGTMPSDDFIGLEFTLTDMGDNVYIEVTDAFMFGSWTDALTATAILYSMDAST